MKCVNSSKSSPFTANVMAGHGNDVDFLVLIRLGCVYFGSWVEMLKAKRRKNRIVCSFSNGMYFKLSSGRPFTSPPFIQPIQRHHYLCRCFVHLLLNNRKAYYCFWIKQSEHEIILHSLVFKAPHSVLSQHTRAHQPSRRN